MRTHIVRYTIGINLRGTEFLAFTSRQYKKEAELARYARMLTQPRDAVCSSRHWWSLERVYTQRIIHLVDSPAAERTDVVLAAGKKKPACTHAKTFALFILSIIMNTPFVNLSCEFSFPNFALYLSRSDLPKICEIKLVFFYLLS